MYCSNLQVRLIANLVLLLTITSPALGAPAEIAPRQDACQTVTKWAHSTYENHWLSTTWDASRPSTFAVLTTSTSTVNAGTNIVYALTPSITQTVTATTTSTPTTSTTTETSKTAAYETLIVTQTQPLCQGQPFTVSNPGTTSSGTTFNHVLTRHNATITETRVGWIAFTRTVATRTVNDATTATLTAGWATVTAAPVVARKIVVETTTYTHTVTTTECQAYTCQAG